MRIQPASKAWPLPFVWMTAILGMACGAGQVGMVLMGVCLTLAVLIFGGPIEHAFARWFNARRPPLP